jgi:hypothetical protein
MSDYDEQQRRWREQRGQMPYLRFPPDWEIKIVPPWRCVDVRFTARKGERTVSVFADLSGNAGGFIDESGDEAPYWEIGGSDWRVPLRDVDGLMREIAAALEGETD